MTDFTRAEAAARAGLDAGYLDRLIELGVIAPKPDGSLHSGPVLFQEGDYFGRTVNMASRIAEYTRPGEVLVTQEVVDAAADSGAAFWEIGPVELKGISGAVRLHAAHRSS